MHTLESMIVIPLLIIIIIFTFSLFSYAAQMDLDEMNYSRCFFLSVMDQASINDKSLNTPFQIINKDLPFMKISTFSSKSEIANRFALPNSTNEFQNSGNWQIIRYNRTFLALASENSQIFTREENNE
ncbi:hypothetical protein [Fusibacter bizertensis]